MTASNDFLGRGRHATHTTPATYTFLRFFNYSRSSFFLLSFVLFVSDFLMLGVFVIVFFIFNYLLFCDRDMLFEMTRSERTTWLGENDEALEVKLP